MRKPAVYYWVLFLFLLQPVVIFAQGQKEASIVRQKRNPFIPLVTSDGKLVNLEQNGNKKQQDIFAIDGISYDPRGVSYAIIGGSVAKIGDFVEDYQVLKIEQDKVILIKDGQTTEIIYNKGEE